MHRPVDQAGITLGRAHRQRVDFQPVQIRKLEYFQKPDRVLFKITVMGQGEPSAIELEAI